MIFCPCECANSPVRRNGSIWLSFHSPESSGVMRPSAVTEVASTQDRPGPREMMPPRCAKCQSVWWPSIAEYWHRGESCGVDILAHAAPRHRTFGEKTNHDAILQR